MKKEKLLNAAAIFIAVFLLALTVLLFTGCGSSKKVTTMDSTIERSKFDSLAWMKEKEKQLDVKYREEFSRRLDEYNRAAEMGIYYDTPEPFDSSLCPPCNNEIEIKPDGTLKAKGNLKSVKSKTTEQRIIIDSSFKKSLDSTVKVLETERFDRKVIEQELIKEKSKVVVKRWPWWVWFGAGAVSMLLLIIGIIFYKKIKERRFFNA